MGQGHPGAINMHPNSAPAYIDTFNEIIKELNELDDNSELDEFTLIRKLNILEARALDMQGSGCDAYRFSALGSIAATRNNIEKARHYHSMAMNLSDDSILKANFVASLSALGLYREALDYIMPLYESNPLNIRAIECIIMVAFDMGDEKMFLDFVHEWAKIKEVDVSEHPLYRSYCNELEESSTLTKSCMAVSSLSIHELYEEDSAEIQ
jgi:tetratricopeptide (TPR) repeat protein